MNKKTKHSIFVIGGGIGVIVVCLILKKAPKEVPKDISYYLIHLGIEIGIAAISVGLIGILLEMKHWSELFKKTVEDAILKPEYVKRMEDESIAQMQKNIFAKRYGEDSIKKDSLFTFFNDELLKSLSTPYRENYQLHLVLHKDENGHIICKENLSYICKRYEGKIQEEVFWSYKENDLENVSKVTCKTYLSGQLISEDLGDCKKNGSSYEYKKSLKNEDNLQVEIQANYTIPLNKLWINDFVTPIKGIKVTIKHSIDCKVQIKHFGYSHPEPEQTTEFYEMKCDSWALKNHGMAILFT